MYHVRMSLDCCRAYVENMASNTLCSFKGVVIWWKSNVSNMFILAFRYRSLMVTNMNQCCVINGESGVSIEDNRFPSTVAVCRIFEPNALRKRGLVQAFITKQQAKLGSKVFVSHSSYMLPNQVCQHYCCRLEKLRPPRFLSAVLCRSQERSATVCSQTTKNPTTQVSKSPLFT